MCGSLRECRRPFLLCSCCSCFETLLKKSLITVTLPRSFIEVVRSLKPTHCSCVLAGCMILMFSKFVNSQCFYHTRRCPKNWPPLYTFKSSTGGSQTMQPFSCCIIEQITLKTSKKCIKQLCFRLLILKFEGWCSLSRNTTSCLLTLPRCML